MGKHLSVEEKLNAAEELRTIKAKVLELRLERGRLKYFLKNKYSEPKRAEFEARIVEINQEICELQLRNGKLVRYLYNAKKSKYQGLHSVNGVCFKLFGKKRSELTDKEKSEYNKFMKKRSNEKKKAKEKAKEKAKMLKYFKEIEADCLDVGNGWWRCFNDGTQYMTSDDLMGCIKEAIQRQVDKIEG